MNSRLMLFALPAVVGVLSAADKPRIFITESGSIQLRGESGAGDRPGLSLSGGASPESVEVMKAFVAHCPGITVTANREKADYVVRFDREAPGPATPFVRGNKVAVFNKSEDLIYGSSTRMLNSAVKGACAAIVKGARN